MKSNWRTTPYFSNVSKKKLSAVKMNKITLDTQCHDEEIVEVTTCNGLVVISTGDRYERVSLEMSVAQARDLMNALAEAIADAGRDKR